MLQISLDRSGTPIHDLFIRKHDRNQVATQQCIAGYGGCDHLMNNLCLNQGTEQLSHWLDLQHLIQILWNFSPPSYTPLEIRHEYINTHAV